MTKHVKLKDAYGALHRIWEALWEIDIPSPTVPEYAEHHKQVQHVMKLIDEEIVKLEEVAEE